MRGWSVWESSELNGCINMYNYYVGVIGVCVCIRVNGVFGLLSKFILNLYRIYTQFMYLPYKLIPYLLLLTKPHNQTL